MIRFSLGGVVLVVVAGCVDVKAQREPARRHIGSTTAALAVADSVRVDGSEAAALLADTAADDDPALRRSYGPVDMKVHACVSRDANGTFVGKQCPTAVVVFGPYVTVPSDADVQFHFDVRGSKALTIGSDVLSDAARQFHGAVDEQLLQPNELRTVNYKIHLFEAARTLETRIGVQGSGLLDFEISNLAMTIR